MKLNQNRKLFIYGCENIAWKTAAILSWTQWVKGKIVCVFSLEIAKAGDDIAVVRCIEKQLSSVVCLVIFFVRSFDVQYVDLYEGN